MAFRRGWLWLAVLALLAAQTLGLAHRVVHPGGMDAGDTARHAHSHDRSDDHDHSIFAALFGDHEAAPDCRLYDQLSHADVLPALAVVAAAVHVPALHLAWRTGEFVARRAALFEARGPPSIR